jgi:aminoglycoside phosphotransferase (APT) family kinase protein
LSWLGHLSKHDPLYGWLRDYVFPIIGLSYYDGIVDVYQLNGSHRIYLYKALRDGSKFKVVGKFYGRESDSKDRKTPALMHEYEGLRRIAELGLDKGPYRAVRCLGFNECIDNVLVTEHVEGDRLDAIIKEAIFNGGSWLLREALSKLARFLYLVHSRSIDYNVKVNFKDEYDYFRKTLSRLRGLPPISSDDFDTLHELAKDWRRKPWMWSASSSQIHGDCTPANFILGKDPELAALDLERSKRSDPAFDTGRVAGELKHNFMAFAGNGLSAESFITHFYKEYCSQDGSSEQLFNEITKRNPFYQATTELRIAKNHWVYPDHRQRLVEEAKKCLRY